MRLSVLGTGYLGAVHAAAMAEIGHDVVGADVDAERIRALAAGRVPFHEPGFPELLQKALDSGRLRFTTSLAEAAAADVHFICVGTPQLPGSHGADLTAVHAVFEGLLPHLANQVRQGRRPLLVGKSTVPVGTAAGLRERLTGAPGVRLAWNPEFLREGTAVRDSLEPDRIVVGVDGPADAEQLRELYEPVLLSGQVPWLVTDLPTAELVKCAANAFLATKISFINAVAEVCELAGADAVRLADALGLDARIGRRFLDAGLGFGGGCLPKDIRAFAHRASQVGAAGLPGLLAAVDEINVGRRERAVQLAVQALDGAPAGQPVTVLGAAFKPGSDDIRDSPALGVAVELARVGAQVRVHDPAAARRAAAAHPELACTEDLGAALSGAHAVVLGTDWVDYARLDPQMVGSLVARRQLVDARNLVDAGAWAVAGWTVRSLGRPVVSSAGVR